MLHYHVWFNLKPGISETLALDKVSHYLSQLFATAEVTDFQVMKNSGKPPKTKLPAYHAWVEFAGQEEFRAAMKRQSERGIHSGGHGQVVAVVNDFYVEIFESADGFRAPFGIQACEI